MSSTYCYLAVRFGSFLLLGLLLGTSKAVASAGQVSSMPPGAFLRTPASDMNALNRELCTDKLVVSRYSRLMRLTPEMVRATFAQLHLAHLQKDMILEVHYVHARETIGAKVRRLRKGAAVFAMSDGTPMLAQVCGNPLRTVGAPGKQLKLHHDSEPNVVKSPDMAAINDTPDFDPTEPLNASPPAASNSITMREAPPIVEVLPENKDTLAADEMPANAVEPGEVIPSQTIAQAQHSLSNWVNGIIPTVITAVGVANVVNPAPPDSSPVKTHPRPVPTKPTHTKPIAPTLTPEPNSLLFAIALATTMLATAGLRRCKAR